jgi:hypothetical protein
MVVTTTIHRRALRKKFFFASADDPFGDSRPRLIPASMGKSMRWLLARSRHALVTLAVVLAAGCSSSAPPTRGGERQGGTSGGDGNGGMGGDGGEGGTGGGKTGGSGGRDSGAAGSGGTISSDGGPPTGADASDAGAMRADATVDGASAVDAAPPSTGSFKHPGILFNAAQLAFVRDKIKAGAAPWKAVYDKMAASRWAALDWAPLPRAIVECGSGSNPNFGCSDERADAEAAYTQALLYFFTGDEAHARKAAEILDGWAKVLQTHTNHNAPLQAGWAGAVFPLAADLLRASYPGWSAAQIDQFKTMLRTAFLPIVMKGDAGANGNWELVMIEATMASAVFLDDRPLFDRAVGMWRKRVPAYMYLTSDGMYPVSPPGTTRTTAQLIDFWQGQTTFVDGLAQETCRDFGHTEWGIAAALAGAEIALQQGVDLYREQGERLRKAMEFHADYVTGKPVPAWLCGGKLTLGGVPTFEIGYNHFHDRLGLDLPLTLKYLEQKTRASDSPVSYFIVWETLTHAAVGWTGLK